MADVDQKPDRATEERRARAEAAWDAFSGRAWKNGHVIPEVMAEFAEAEARAAVTAFVGRVNARAEADMLAGNPITGAHHRAMGYELTLLHMGAVEGAATPSQEK